MNVRLTGLVGLGGCVLKNASAIDETWRGEAEIVEPPVATGLAGEAASPLATSSHCGVFQPQDEPGQKELAVVQPEGARADWYVPLHLLRGRDTLTWKYPACYDFRKAGSQIGT